MKKLLPLLSILIASITHGQIISQYVETETGTTPKGIEIWNNTPATLDFATHNLVIEKGVNGATPTPDFTLSTGTLASGDVIVIGTADIGQYMSDHGITSAFHLEPFTFNGDDALVVKYGGVTTDVFGIPGTDPGSAWSGNGVSTRNSNIVLLPSITTGTTSGFTDPSTRFSTVNTTPSDTANGGLAGIGITPGTPVPANLQNTSFRTEVVGGSVQIDWSTEHEALISLIRENAYGHRAELLHEVSENEGSYTDIGLMKGSYIYTLYIHEDLKRELVASCMVDIHTLDRITAHPNPTRDRIYIQPLSDMDVISVFDTHGREVLHIADPTERQMIDLSPMPSGVYLIHTPRSSMQVIKE